MLQLERSDKFSTYEGKGNQMAVTPQDAATIMLIRNAPSRKGIEVLMVQRSTESDFCPGVYVFPGGALETADYAQQIEEICSGLTLEQAQRIIEDAPRPEKALGLFVAAIREVFEEVGIILAYRDGSLITLNTEDERRFAAYRSQIHQGSLSFTDLIRQERLALATDQIFYFAHLITPPPSPIRFNTRFFVAPAPQHQNPLHDALETIDCRWINPQEALEGYKRREFPVILPTIRNLEALAGFPSVDTVISSARSRKVTLGSLWPGTA